MVRRLAFFSLLALATSLAARPAAAQDLTELARRAKHSVVVLKALDRFGRELSTGSGFSFSGAQVVREETGTYLRNLVISAVFFALVYFAFRRLR